MCYCSAIKPSLEKALSEDCVREQRIVQVGSNPFGSRCNPVTKEIKGLPRVIPFTRHKDTCPVRQSGLWQTQANSVLCQNVLIARLFRSSFLQPLIRLLY